MAKMTFDEALQAINDERSVNYSDVRADALRRIIWVAEWHLPGCLSESRAYCTTKRDAIECALSMAEGENGVPRGMRGELERNGWSDLTPPDGWARGAITTIEKHTLGNLL